MSSRPTAAPTRGIIVLVVAVALGAVLLSQTERVIGSPEEGSAAPDTSSTTTTAEVTDLTASSVDPTAGGQAPKPPAEVSVIVLNGSGQTGVATSNANAAAAAGFSSLEAQNALPTETTTVYYAPGFEADAAAVKLALRLTEAPVQPAPAEPVVPEAAEADVVVLLGTDYEASGGAGTTTTEG
jgi:hypothetical protein